MAVLIAATITTTAATRWTRGRWEHRPPLTVSTRRRRPRISNESNTSRWYWRWWPSRGDPQKLANSAAAARAASTRLHNALKKGSGSCSRNLTFHQATRTLSEDTWLWVASLHRRLIQPHLANTCSSSSSNKSTQTTNIPFTRWIRASLRRRQTLAARCSQVEQEAQQPSSPLTWRWSGSTLRS